MEPQGQSQVTPEGNVPIQPQGEPAAPAQPDLSGLLSEHFGEGISVESLKAALAERDTLRNSAPTFASPVIEKANELFAQGATLQDVQHFLSIQSMDFGQMGDAELLRHSVKAQYPMFSPEMVDAYISDQLGLGELLGNESVTSPSLMVKATLAKQEAIKVLEGQKIKASQPASVQQTLAARQAQERVVADATNTAMSVAEQTKSMKIAAADYEGFDFQIPKEVADAAREQLALALAEAGRSGQKLDAAATYQQFVRFAAFDQILAAAVKDAQAKAQMAIARQHAGHPMPQGGQAPPPTSRPAPSKPGGDGYF